MNNYAVELIREPQIMVVRRKYYFMVQTKYLSERQIYAEAFLRGLVNGNRDEIVTNQLKQVLDMQLKCDYEKWVATGQDLTPTFMERRPTMEEMSQIIREMINEFSRLEFVGASNYAKGVQLDFAISCMKRTNYETVDNLREIYEMILEINNRYHRLWMDENNNVTQEQPNISNTGTSRYYTPPQQSWHNCNGWEQVPQNQFGMSTPYPNRSQQGANVSGGNYMNNTSPSANYSRQRQIFNVSSPNERDRSVIQPNSILGGRVNASLIGPHKVSATIINIISKNLYEANMDALDQIETWESQAMSLAVPIDYFLSYMEVLLSKEIQPWWQVNRPRINNWEQFRVQFLEDFGDQNRAIKADRAIANLSQGKDETFQQLFLRFTKLMKHAKPEKSDEDKLYILKSALKPALRSACMTATTLAGLKRMSYEFEGMEQMYHTKESNNVYQINTVDMTEMQNEIEKKNYWDNEIEWNNVPNDDRLLVIEENLEKRKLAMSQQWTKEQKAEWLRNQLCFNCDKKGHLQSQCDKQWTSHCVKCGTKGVTVRDCNKCLGNASTSTGKGASR
jgi:hypothetical protein